MPNEIIKRRTEKAWRHRDREMYGSQNLWSVFASLQGLIIGIITILYTIQNRIIINKSILFIVFILACTTMIILVILSTWSRDLDCRRASYFEITSTDQSTWPQDFDYKKVDNKYKSDFKYYKKWRLPLESAAFFALITNILILYILIKGIK